MREDSMEICDAEDDGLRFSASSPHRRQRERKRRRLSGSLSRATRGYSEIEIDPIARSSELESSPPLEDRQTPTEDVYDTINSPTTRRPMSTPLPTNMRTAFNPVSRRDTHSGYDVNPPPSVGMALDDDSETLGSTFAASTPLRRPRFILPITPSKLEKENNGGVQPVETLFSPTLTRNSRVNRSRRPADLEYVAGGMASEVRNWIFEVNARKQTLQPSATQRLCEASQAPVRYYVTAKIDKVETSLEQRSSRRRGTALTASGQAAPKTLIIPSKKLPESRPKFDKALLFGEPMIESGVRSTQVHGARSVVQSGDWVGIRRGMVWEMDISPVTGSALANAETEQEQRDVLSEKWLVGLEWDIILPPTACQD